MTAGARRAPLISVVVPAYNETKLIESCLDSIICAFDGAGLDAGQRELIVVDNGSSDDTAVKAEARGATVVKEPVRQIARARNTGAAAARGDWLLFVDADSWPGRLLIQDLLHAMDQRDVVGGGATVRMGSLPLAMRVALGSWNLCSRCMRWAAGSFIFCRRDAFEAVNGFDPDLFAGEEINLSSKLKRFARWRGMRFIILSRHPLASSARKGELYSAGEMFSALARIIRHPRRFFRDPSICYVWYDGRR